MQQGCRQKCLREQPGYLKDKELDSWGSQAGVHQLRHGAVLQQPHVHRRLLLLILLPLLLLLLLLLSVHYDTDLVKAIHCNNKRKLVKDFTDISNELQSLHCHQSLATHCNRDQIASQPQPRVA